MRFLDNRRLSSPTEFWRLLSRDHSDQISPIINQVIQSTLAIPYGSTKAESAFAYLKLEKTSQRSHLSVETVKAHIRIAMHPDTIDIFNPEKAIEEYKKTSALCD